jgi:perosamine synthetase
MAKRKTIVMFAPYVSDEAIARVEGVLRNRWIGQGSLVDEFEQAVEKVLGVPHAVAVNCSSSALRLALDISGVRPGDEVVTTPMTCTLTNHPILEQFAVPVFADIQYDTGNIDPNDVERRITERTKAIVCTHWGGYPCDLDELNQIAERHGLPVIEDASEAFGATYRGRAIGAISRFTAFSFQAIQLITTGEGGMLITRDASDAEIARTQRWYGIDRKGRKPNIWGYYDFDIVTVGYGYHMTNIAAAIGLENLKSLKSQQLRRQAIAQRYREAFKDVAGVTLLRSDNDRTSSNHFFTMHVERRDDFCRMMADRGIEVSIVHYRNDAYTVFGGIRDDLPQLDRFSSSYIALPLHMHLTDDDVEYIIETVRSGW